MSDTPEQLAELINRLRIYGHPGLDLSPGTPLYGEAADALESLLRTAVTPSWVPVSERLPDMSKERSTWMESVRVMVRVEKTDFDIYEAFAKLTKAEGKYEWRIEGHNGNWHQFVTHWMPLPLALGAGKP